MAIDTPGLHAARSPERRSSWPYGGVIPQRFSRNLELYQRRGGLIDLAGDAGAYLGSDKVHDIERFFGLSLAFDQIHKEQLEGHFAELGVYQGDTAALLARHARRLNRHLYLLDTFTGFDRRDFVGVDAGRAGGFSDTSLDRVRARVGLEATSYIEGYFPQTAPQLPENGRYCLVHIDTDLYSSILSGLDYFYPRMVPGGFMVIHDYGSLEWPGAERAVDEFFADKPESVISLPDSAGSAVIRRVRQADPHTNWYVSRRLISAGRWHSPANDGLAYVLGDGWSVAEGWGVWGVGQVHRLHFCTAERGEEQLTLECDVHAYLPAGEADRPIMVMVDGDPAGIWNFPPATNRAVRILRVPPGPGLHTIEFHHDRTVVPSDVHPTDPGARPLGMALHRMRVT